jgi:hypothetical protein
VSAAGGALPPEEVVSGERLQGLADVTVLPRALARRHPEAELIGREVVRFDEHRTIGDAALGRLSAARSLFVYTHALALFQQHVWPRLTGTGYRLVTHNSDDPVDARHLGWIEDAGDKLDHWWTSNLAVEHPRLSPLPLGIANARWPHGDAGALCAAAEQAARQAPTELVHALFDLTTHPDRGRAWAAARAAFPALPAAPEPLSFADYLRDLARHRFCLCPRGNGLETHRFWECQYLGVVPVVERSTQTGLWARRGLPMVQLGDWAELSRDLLEDSRATPVRPAPPVLRLSHHESSIGGADCCSG